MSLILVIIIVIVCLCLALYAVQLLPLPSDPPMQLIKPLLMVLCIVVAILVIASKAGLAVL
jgi:hypothetical protein